MADILVDDRVSRLRPTAVNRALQAMRKLEAEGRSLVSLMRGQPDTPTPPHIVEAAIRSMRDGRTGYADNRGEPALRRAVAEKLRRDQGLSYDPDREILITDGATLGLHAALGALVPPDGNVLLPDPIYDAYAGPIELWGGKPTPVPAEVRDGRFTLGSEPVRGRLGLQPGHHPAQHALEPGRHGPDPRGAGRRHGVRKARTQELPRAQRRDL